MPLKKILLYLIVLLNFIGCTSEKAKQEKFVLDTIQMIKTENASGLYNLHLSHEKAAELGMYLFANYTDLENSESPKEFIEIQRKIGLEVMPEDIQKIKNYFAQAKTSISLSELELVGYTFHELEEKRVTNTISKRSEILKFYSLNIKLQTKNQTKVSVLIPNVCVINSTWYIYSTSFPGIVIQKL